MLPKVLTSFPVHGCMCTHVDVCVCNVCVSVWSCMCVRKCEWTRVWTHVCVCVATCVHVYRNLNGCNLLSQSCSVVLTVGPCLLQWQNGNKYKYRAFLSLSSPRSSSENLFLKFIPQIPILGIAEQLR